MGGNFLFLEQVFTILALVHFSGGMLPLIESGGFSEGEAVVSTATGPIGATYFVLIYLVTLFLLLLRWKRVLVGLSKNKLLLGLSLLIALSFTWSVLPTTTLIQSGRVIFSILFGLYFGTRYTLREQIDILTKAFIFILLSSILFMILPPRYGIMGGVHVGALRGIYVHKNQFGMTMAIGAIMFLIRAVSRPNVGTVKYWLLLLVSVGMIVLSRSSGAAFVFTGAVLVFCLCYSHVLVRWKSLFIIPLTLLSLSLFAAVVFLVLNSLGAVAEASGKDVTLTGRTVFWPILIYMISRRPLLGYGVAGFWNGKDGPSSYVIEKAMWEVPEAHNGFLELGLSLGGIGLALFLMGYALTFFRAANCLRVNRTAESTWPLIYLSIILLSNITESSLLQSGFPWLLYVTTVVSLSVQPARSIAPRISRGWSDRTLQQQHQ